MILILTYIAGVATASLLSWIYQRAYRPGSAEEMQDLLQAVDMRIKRIKDLEQGVTPQQVAGIKGQMNVLSDRITVLESAPAENQELDLQKMIEFANVFGAHAHSQGTE